MSDIHALLYKASAISDAAIPPHVQAPSADVQHISVDTLTIDVARALRTEAQTKPVAGDERSFVVHFQHATHEAQNALLKLLEEPPSYARFYILVPHESVLIPTVRSRLIDGAKDTPQFDTHDATAFLACSYGERIELIAQKHKQKDTAWMERVVRGVDAIKRSKDSYTACERSAVHFANVHIGLRGASRKMILEHLALTLQ